MRGVVTEIDRIRENYPIVVMCNGEWFTFSEEGLFSTVHNPAQLEHLSGLLPKLGEEYEFSMDEKNWIKDKLIGFQTEVEIANPFNRSIPKPTLTPE